MIMWRIVAGVVLAGVLASCSLSAGGEQMVGKQLPRTRLTMLNGKGLPLDEFRGKSTVLVFWASWCRKSPRVLKAINDYAEKFSGRDDVAFVAVSVDKSEAFEKVKERIEDNKLTEFKHAFSGNEIYDETYMAFQESDLPAVYVIDKSGTIIARGHNLDVVEENFK